MKNKAAQNPQLARDNKICFCAGTIMGLLVGAQMIIALYVGH